LGVCVWGGDRYLGSASLGLEGLVLRPSAPLEATLQLRNAQAVRSPTQPARPQRVAQESAQGLSAQLLV
jgi:hypothetical protein